MADKKDPLPALATFAVWMLASFFCHKLAKEAMILYVRDETSIPFLVIPLFVTIIQILCCYSTTTMDAGRLSYVLAASHVLATLTTNTSLALTYASSALAVKTLEPMTSALLQRWLLKTPIGAESAEGMAVAVAGAILYLGNPLHDLSDAGAVLMALISNLTLGVRNVVMKRSSKSSSGSANGRLRTWHKILFFYSCAIISILLVRLWAKSTPGNQSHVTFANFLPVAMASGTCHVIYSYVSINVVLRHMSVVSHALANILKRVLVVLLLHVSGQRRAASWWNWAGLVLCTLGMLLYNRKEICPSSQPCGLLAPGDKEKDQSARRNGWYEITETISRFKQRRFAWLLVFVGIIGLFTMLPENNAGYYWGNVRVSYVLKSNPRGHEKSETDYALNLRFGYQTWTDGKPLISGPISFQPNRKKQREIDEFFSREHLISTPFDTDGLSPYLTTAKEAINENKRVLLNLLRDLLRGKKYAVLFDLAAFENKGDAAISLGELMILEDLGVKLVTYINVRRCNITLVQRAMKIAQKYPKNSTVILFHGGGNLFAQFNVDRFRQHSLRLSSGYQQLMFSNSVWLRDSKKGFRKTYRNFCCNSNLTILIRDRLSLRIVQRLFKGGTRFILAPDMAMHIGYVGRYAAPYYDISWLRRTDEKNAIFDNIPTFPVNISVFVWDWRPMLSIPDKHSVKMAMNVVHNGFGILQRGKVLITDRLHGHIMSMLFDIPHVLLDNADQKLSSFHNTWTRGVQNCRLADNAKDAARLALELLEEYKDTLPERLTAVDLKEPDF